MINLLMEIWPGILLGMVWILIGVGTARLVDYAFDMADDAVGRLLVLLVWPLVLVMVCFVPASHFKRN